MLLSGERWLRLLPGGEGGLRWRWLRCRGLRVTVSHTLWLLSTQVVPCLHPLSILLSLILPLPCPCLILSFVVSNSTCSILKPSFALIHLCLVHIFSFSLSLSLSFYPIPVPLLLRPTLTCSNQGHGVCTAALSSPGIAGAWQHRCGAGHPLERVRVPNCT